MKKVILSVILVIVLVFVSLSALIGFNFYKAIKTTFVGTKAVSNSSSGDNQSSGTILEKLRRKEQVGIAFLGYGGGNHAGAYLTDTILVAILDGKRKTINLFSIPRDTWVKIPTTGDEGNFYKINTAYVIGSDDYLSRQNNVQPNYPKIKDQFKGVNGGGNLSKNVIGQVLGVPIDYYVSIDFSGFIETIDKIGGVDIQVVKVFDDYEYPIEGKETDNCGHTDEEIEQMKKDQDNPFTSENFPCRFEHLHFDAGLQNMDGARALKFVRSRHAKGDEGSDFGRSRRQIQLLLAVKDKISDPLVFLNTIFSAGDISQHFKTDIPFSDVLDLGRNYGELKDYKIKNVAFTDQNFLRSDWSDDGQWILIPRVGANDWTEMRSYVQVVLNQNYFYPNLTVQILNGTESPGLGNIAMNRLKEKGIQFAFLGNSRGRDYKNSEVRFKDSSLSQNSSFVDVLKGEFGQDIIFSNEALPKESEYEVEIILGQDYYLRQGNKLLNEPSVH